MARRSERFGLRPWLQPESKCSLTHLHGLQPIDGATFLDVRHVRLPEPQHRKWSVKFTDDRTLSHGSADPSMRRDSAVSSSGTSCNQVVKSMAIRTVCRLSMPYSLHEAVTSRSTIGRRRRDKPDMQSRRLQYVKFQLDGVAVEY